MTSSYHTNLIQKPVRTGLVSVFQETGDHKAGGPFFLFLCLEDILQIHFFSFQSFYPAKDIVIVQSAAFVFWSGRRLFLFLFYLRTVGASRPSSKPVAMMVTYSSSSSDSLILAPKMISQASPALSRIASVISLTSNMLKFMPPSM